MSRWLLFFYLTLNALLAPARPTLAQIKPANGQFLSEGRAIDEFHCVPNASGPRPAIILIHGCGPLGFGDDEYHEMCASLAEHSYYAMFVEYYSRTGQPNCAQFANDLENSLAARTPLPSAIYIRTISAAIESLQANDKIDSTHIGLLAFADGVCAALTIASVDPDIRAVVGYYPFVTPRLEMFVRQAKVFPSTLMLRGEGDSRVSGSYAREMEDLLSQHQGDHQVHTYSDVEHAFNFHEARGFDPVATKDAWSRAIAFFDNHLR
jgi:dienelactone hydrolase